MQLGTFSAHIVVDGVPLKEYDVVYESPTKIICWVASEEGKTFGVQWKCHERRRTAGTRGDVTLDGISGGRQWIHPGTLGKGNTVTRSSSIVGTTKRDFMFTRVDLSDDDSLLDKAIPKDFGQICLKLRRGKIHEEPRQPSPDGPAMEECSKVIRDNKFHEKSKKATVHCVGYGPGRTVTYSSTRRFLVPNNKPRISFVFKYQPLSVLQANGVAPRPEAANNATFGGEQSELNDRIHDLEHELKRLRDQIQPDDAEDQKPKRVKREHLDERGSRSRVFAPGEVIDLT